MLKLYLRWFDREPVGALLPAKSSRELIDLDALGAFTAPRRTRRYRCVDCGLLETVHVYPAGDHLLQCQQCGSRSVDLQGPPFLTVQVRHDWLPGVLSRLMVGESASPAMLVHNRVWHLADIDTPRGQVAVMLVRSGWQCDYTEVAAVLRKFGRPRQIVLTTSRIEQEELNSAGRVVIPLVSVAKLDAQGLWLERETLIEHYLRGVNQARKLLLHPTLKSDQQLWFELGPDNAWVRVNNRTVRLWGKQRLFVASIARAHVRNQPHRRLADAVNDAGYEGDVRSLHQICSRRDFREVIGIADGFVWIRDDVQ
ncbi:hypothetical protein J5226_03705 [Lysobacter sp. K5869]|uniref:hypothetical protein n=1 Tax=Lysobacter sp. K5869 TaxID=2820808 RepID=UPI001C0609DE|nr:hypothetical protein [Lysobacter sp. K5869]QWP77522.1 hypothetical protein J5226_03705 [Lysobacter sp. K5869]